MNQFNHTITVQAPISAVYQLWTRLEYFPNVMEAVEAVTQLTDIESLWRVQIMGVTREWKSQIVDQIPNSLITWTSTSGAKHAGKVSFHAVDSRTTRVTLEIEYAPADWKESLGSEIGILDYHIKRDLKSFKSYIESRTQVSGIWRIARSTE